MANLTPEHFAARFASYANNKDSLIAHCETAVVETRWATDQMASPEPLWDQLDSGLEAVHGWRTFKGRWINSSRDYWSPVRHGFDQQKRLRVVEREYGKYLFEHDESGIDEVAFLIRSEHLARYVLSAATGAVVEKYNLSGNYFSVVEYQYDRDHLIKSVHRGWQKIEGKFTESGIVDIYYYEYGRDGLVARVWKELLGTKISWKEVVFSRPQPGQTVQSALQDVEDLLVAQIPLVVQEHAAASPIFAVGIGYCGEDITSGWPGRLVLVTDSHRQHCHRHRTEDFGYALWHEDESENSAHDPGVFNEGVCSDESLFELHEKTLRALELAELATPKFRYDELRLALCRVARRANSLDWSRLASVTDDFFVTPLDDHGETDLLTNLKASLSAERIALLKSRGVI